MPYIDGFVAAVPTANKEAYQQHAERAAELMKEFGVIKAVECWGDDVPDGDVTSFPMAVKCQSDETVVFSWFWWPDKETRDKGWEAAMADPRMQEETDTMPFDGRRLIYGGFETLVDV